MIAGIVLSGTSGYSIVCSIDMGAEDIAVSDSFPTLLDASVIFLSTNQFIEKQTYIAVVMRLVGGFGEVQLHYTLRASVRNKDTP